MDQTIKTVFRFASCMHIRRATVMYHCTNAFRSLDRFWPESTLQKSGFIFLHPREWAPRLIQVKIKNNKRSVFPFKASQTDTNKITRTPIFFMAVHLSLLQVYCYFAYFRRSSNLPKLHVYMCFYFSSFYFMCVCIHHTHTHTAQFTSLLTIFLLFV